jgi:O-antigen/teichoic acid export membrane protein
MTSLKLFVNKICQLVKDAGAKGFFHLLSANVLIGFLGFGSQLLVAKFLSPVELGQIKIMQSFMGVATIFAGFGFNSAVLKLCSEDRSEGDRSRIFNNNLYFSIVPLLIVLILLFISVKLSLLSPDKTVNKWLPFYMLIIPASIYTSLIITYLQAIKKIKLMATLQILIRVSGFIVIVVTTYFFGFAGFILSTICVGYIALLPLFNTIKENINIQSVAQNPNIFSLSFYYAKWSVSANAVSSMGKYMDIFMLNYLLKDREGIGYYSLATIFILGLEYITSTVQSISTPYFSEKSVNKKEFLRILWKYEKLMILLASSVATFAFIIVPPFIRIVYGSNYEIAGTCFRILTLKYFFWSCYALIGVAIFGLGKVLYNFIADLVFVLISLLLSYFLVTSQGVIGASIAQATASFIAMIIFLVTIKYVVGDLFERHV